MGVWRLPRGQKAIGGSRMAALDAAGACSAKSVSKFQKLLGFRFLMHCYAILNKRFLIAYVKFSFYARETENAHTFRTLWGMLLMPPGSTGARSERSPLRTVSLSVSSRSPLTIRCQLAQRTAVGTEPSAPRPSAVVGVQSTPLPCRRRSLV